MSSAFVLNVPMVAITKHIVTVQPGGRIEINDPQLPEGACAEVTVSVRHAPARTPAERLAALDALQQSLKLDAEKVANWTADIRAEHEASGPQE
ncbi:MAG TPA: hypothetical protein VF669_15810 [Tepidisphaeraceae bacterium]